MKKQKINKIDRLYIYVFAISFLYLLFDYINVLYNYLSLSESIKFSNNSLIVYSVFYAISLLYFLLKVPLNKNLRLLFPFMFFYLYIFIDNFISGGSFIDILKMSTWFILFVVGLNYGSCKSELVSFIGLKFIYFIFIPLSLYICYLLLNNSFINPDIFFVIIIFVPFIFYFPKNKIRILLLLFLALLLLLSMKRSIIIAFILSMIGYLGFKKNIKYFLFLFPIFILVYFEGNFVSKLLERFYALTSDGGSGRDSIYSAIFQLSFDKSSFSELLFGHGKNSSLAFLGMYAHNDFLQLLLDFGLIGVLLYIFSYLNLIIIINKHLRNNKKDANARIYKSILYLLFPLVMLNCLIYHPFYLPIVMFGLGISCGLIIKKSSYEGISYFS